MVRNGVTHITQSPDSGVRFGPYMWVSGGYLSRHFDHESRSSHTVPMPNGAAEGGKRMTNRQFAEAIGVTESYASLIRAGKRLPGGAALVSIATVFDLDANQLVRAYQRGPRAVAQFLEERLPRVE